MPVQGATWAAFAYLVSVGTVGVFLLFLFVLKRWQASAVAYLFVLAPFVAGALGAWLLGEDVSPLTALGAILVLAGVYVGALAPAMLAARAAKLRTDSSDLAGKSPLFVERVSRLSANPSTLEWEKATEGKRTARRNILCEDRDNPGHYLNIVFFDSHEAAMENSAMPETDALSRKMMSFADGPPTFYNLDVIDDRE